VQRSRVGVTKVREVLARVTPAQWATFLESFRMALEVSVGDWRGGEEEIGPDGRIVRTWPSFDYAPEVGALVHLAYDYGLIVPFNWDAWLGSFEEREVIPCNTPVDAVRNLTAAVRGERFCEGLLDERFRDGTFHRIYTALEKAYGQAP